MLASEARASMSQGSTRLAVLRANHGGAAGSTSAVVDQSARELVAGNDPPPLLVFFFFPRLEHAPRDAPASRRRSYVAATELVLLALIKAQTGE